MKVRKLFFNDKKEQKWLNEMSASGWHVTNFKNFTATYTFEYDPNKQYNYVVDYIGHRDKDYFDFVVGTGVELVFNNSFWAFFRKDVEDGPFELYSDVPSKMAYLNKLLTLYVFFTLLNLFGIVTNVNFFLENQVSFHLFLVLINVIIIIPMVSLIFTTVKRKRDLTAEVNIFE